MARYHSDLYLCKHRDKPPWCRVPCEAEKNDKDDRRSECWTNINPEMTNHYCDSNKPNGSEATGDSWTQGEKRTLVDNESYEPRSLFGKKGEG